MAYVWSLTSYLNQRNDKHLVVVAAAVTVLLFTDLAFLPLVLLTWPVVWSARLRDSSAGFDKATPEIRRALRDTAILPALPLGAGLLYLIASTALGSFTGTSMRSLDSIPVPETVLAAEVGQQFLTVLPFVFILVLSSYQRPAVLIATAMPFLALSLGGQSPQAGFSHIGIPLMAIIISVVMIPYVQFSQKESAPVGKGITALTLLAALLFSSAAGFQLIKTGVHSAVNRAYSAFLFDRETQFLPESNASSDRLRALYDSEPELGWDHESAPSVEVVVPEGRIQTDTQRVPLPVTESPATVQTPSVSTQSGSRFAIVDSGENAPEIIWNDTERYYVEVRITTNTGAATARNYQSWLDRSGEEEVTLIPQYREGMRIRWLIGTGRYATFRAGVDQIERERGSAANVFITLYHLTDFRIFGDAPNFNPAEDAFSIELGVYYTVNEARLLALYLTRKSGMSARVFSSSE
jgi:hypothetical protein